VQQHGVETQNVTARRRSGFIIDEDLGLPIVRLLDLLYQ
jgi:hypothetical protein